MSEVWMVDREFNPAGNMTNRTGLGQTPTPPAIETPLTVSPDRHSGVESQPVRNAGSDPAGDVLPEQS